ncbi:MAG: hypothetical protein EBU01_04055, partial [Crocinitomicaceae bacterium]|nr:hypothetical protein [Crocinitomicaceae bacterium]
MLVAAMTAPSFEEKTEKFALAMQKFPDNAETYFMYAKLCNNEAKRLMQSDDTYDQGKAFQLKSLAFYQNTIKKCPDFHADCYYVIGSLLFEKGDVKNAIPFFKKFVDFPQDDYSKLPEDYMQKKSEISTIIEDVEFEKNMRDNPVPFLPHKVEMVLSLI